MPENIFGATSQFFKQNFHIMCLFLLTNKTTLGSHDVKELFLIMLQLFFSSPVL